MTLFRVALALSLLPMLATATAAHGTELQVEELLYTDSFDDGYLGRILNVHVGLPGGTVLPGRLYSPINPSGAAIVMMHGCSGLWSDGVPWTVAQAAIEKWGRKLAESGHFALAIDSYTARTPSGIDPHDFQQQCTGDLYEGVVDPYTTRVSDMDGAIAWMRTYLGSAATARIAALGWSQGGQSVLVRSAETYRDENVSRFTDGEDSTTQLASVVFYPGCGTRLGFVADGTLASSFWRPHHDLRMNHGGADPLHTTCDDRAQIAIDDYDSRVDSGHWLDYVVYPDAHHSFDGTIADWPSARCAPNDPPSDVCAASDADITSLDFLSVRLAAPLAVP